MPKFFRQSVHVWFRGLLSAFIGGGASSVTSGASVSLVDSDHFKMGSWNQMKVMMVSFVFSGFLTMMAYLKQSPIPPEDDGPTLLKENNG